MNKNELGIYELAELFGITPQAIRKYENLKIMCPSRKEDNQFRKYGGREIVKLIWTRSLTLEGFQLKQIAKIFETETPDVLLEQNAMLQEKITREIILRKRLLQKLERQEEEINGWIARAGRPRIIRMPALYCCVLMDADAVVEKNGIERQNLKKWIQALPFVSISFIGLKTYGFANCLTMDEEERELYDLKDLIPDFVIPEQAAVFYDLVIEPCDDADISKEIIMRGMESAVRMGFHLTGEYVALYHAYNQGNDAQRSFVKCVFFLQEKGS